MKKLVIFTASVAAAATVALAHEGHEHATGVVRERMELMTSMGDHLLAISKRLRANKDLANVADDARAIEELARKMAPQFPVGSTQFPTAAKPEIWQEWADFDAKAKKLETEARKLAATNPSDGHALRSQFRAVAYTCDGCHETYRTTK
jgi:cytochrome c556